MNFELTEKEKAQFDSWKKTLPPIEADVWGPNFCFEYIFIPTGLGTVKKIRRMDGHELDLTDYDEW